MIKKCKKTNCLLFKKGIEVPYSGNRNPKVLFIAESPGQIEEAVGATLVGDSGKLAQEYCEAAGLNWSDFLKLNAARCGINKKQLTISQILKILYYCRPKIEFVVKTLKPKLIVLFGDIALRQITKKGGITKNRGAFSWSDEFNCWLFATYHTSPQNYRFKPRIINDLKMVKDFIANDYKPATLKEDVNYIDIDTISKNISIFSGIVNDWFHLGKIIGIDSETQGADIYNPNYVFISYSVSDGTGLGWQIRLWEESDKNDYDKKIQWMRPEGEKKKKVLTDVYIKKCPNFNEKLALLNTILIEKNIRKFVMTSYDFHAFKSIGCNNINSMIDIQALANLIDENLYCNSSLADLQIGFTDVRVNYKNAFNSTHDKGDMLLVDKLDRIGFTNYACMDADVTRQVGLTIKNKLMKNKKLLRYANKFTIPVCNILAKMENIGVCINKEQLPETKKEIDKMRKEAERKALKCVTKKMKEKHLEKGLKLTRDLFLQDILFGKDGFGLKPIKKTKTGNSVAFETRQKLLDKKISETARTFITQYEEWSKCNTIVTRYLTGFEKRIKSDDRVHSRITLATARNGRTSSSNPNLQNIPVRSNLAKPIRRLLTAPKGYLFLAADESQNELRWIADVANDPEMIRVFNSGEDIHTNTAKLLVERVGKTWTNLSRIEKKSFRRSAKSVNFGLIYGMSTKGFITYNKIEYGINLTYSEAAAWIHIFFNVLYKRILNYHNNAIESCKLHGYIESPLGRRRRLFDINSPNQYIRGYAERQAINFPISSPASDTVLLAAKEINKMDLDPVEFRNNLFIHDELIFEVKDNSKVEDYARMIKHEMEHPPLYRNFGVKLKVPLKAEVKWGYSLGDLTEMNLGD